jgi:hypothetical protein
MPYGSVLTDVVQSSVTGTPPQFNDGAGTQIGTLCRASGSYSYVNGSSAPSKNATYNITSITLNATGNYTFAFTTALPDANYSVVISNNYTAAINSTIYATYAKTTSTFSVYAGYVSSTGGACALLSYGLDFAVFR